MSSRPRRVYCTSGQLPSFRHHRQHHAGVFIDVLKRPTPTTAGSKPDPRCPTAAATLPTVSPPSRAAHPPWPFPSAGPPSTPVTKNAGQRAWAQKGGPSSTMFIAQLRRFIWRIQRFFGPPVVGLALGFGFTRRDQPTGHPGWTKGLVSAQTVGSRVMRSIPAGPGYGSAAHPMAGIRATTPGVLFVVESADASADLGASRSQAAGVPAGRRCGQ